MNTTQIQMDDFEIEYGVGDIECTNVSEVGFTDKHGDDWETWPSMNDGAEYYARRKRDWYTVEVMSVE